ncbi:MAG TPA: ABC transporter substrate-binding protein, partial [Bryobacteraceae bacterium]|nr:ABC transporter substrate-binding protein [Bryobacteraceae bacterium]
GEVGRYGGTLVVPQRAEPKTLNPVTALDAPSRDVIRRMMADLVSINRQTQETEPSIAKSWTVSKDGREFVLDLRRGLRFSDGHPMDADDVLFTFQVYLDENVHSPQRDLLIVGDRPLRVEKLDQYRVRFRLAQPYAASERIFDSLAILPRHLLEQAWREGKLADAWSLNVAPASIAGMGPFRLKEYQPGVRIVLEKNPYYWKTDRQGNRLPYLAQIEFRFVPVEDAQVLRFMSGEADILNRIGYRNFEMLRRDAQTKDDQLLDAGPGLEYNFLFFNLGPVDAQRYPEIALRQAWFRNLQFRQAVSAALDRDAIVRLVYGGHAAPLWGHVTPGNRLWQNTALPKPSHSAERARQLLRGAGFHWDQDGALLDSSGKRLEFSLVVSSSSPERLQMATVIQDDLKQIGILVHVVSLEFRALLDRVLNSREYEACILGLGGGDADPNSEMNVWLSNGASHLWSLGQPQPMTPWEAELDRLVRQQMITLNRSERKRLYDRVQEIATENLPLICLASPNVLVAARRDLGNFKPSVLDHYTLWNVEQLYWRRPAPGASTARKETKLP